MVERERGKCKAWAVVSIEAKGHYRARIEAACHLAALLGSVSDALIETIVDPNLIAAPVLRRLLSACGGLVARATSA